MNLYIDLSKAVQIPNTSTDRVDGDQAARAHEESFNRRGSGALGGDASEDDPDKGRDWDHKDEPKKSQEAVEILKSFSSSLRAEIEKSVPNEREVEYLTSVCGYEVEDVMKGRARIVGSERSRFNDWLHQRLQKSLSRLAR